jgi:hypothetical protein
MGILLANTPDEVGIEFGLPAWARHQHAKVDINQTFPLVPVQVMDGCLKAILESTTCKSQLQTPAPQTPATPQDRTWLSTIHKFLPHTSHLDGR